MGATNSNVIKGEVERAAKKAAYSPFVETLTRLGYGARGLIYAVMGVLALDVVLGKSGSPANQQGAIVTIGKQPAGMILLWIVLIGLVSYSLWGVIRALFDPLHKGHDLKGVVTRIGFLLSAVGYLLLAVPTYGYIRSGGNAGQGSLSLSSIMATPNGHWLIALIGLVVIADGLYQIYLGFNAKFDKQFQMYAMTAEEVKVAIQLGRIGTATRGFIFALVGILVFQAGLQSNPSQPIGIDAALATLMRQPYGVWLVGLAGIGLIAFGGYSMASMVWFRLKRQGGGTNG